jgi:hypothetical protein
MPYRIVNHRDWPAIRLALFLLLCVAAVVVLTVRCSAEAEQISQHPLTVFTAMTKADLANAEVRYRGRPYTFHWEIDPAVCDNGPQQFMAGYCYGEPMHHVEVDGWAGGTLYQGYCGRVRQVKVLCRGEICADCSCSEEGCE